MDVWDIITTIMVASISAVALIKSNQYNISDKVTRGQWAFEQFIKSFEQYNSDQTSEYLVDFRVCSMLCYLYIDDSFKEDILLIRALVTEKKLEQACAKEISLIQKYYKSYKVKKYSNPRKKL